MQIILAAVVAGLAGVGIAHAETQITGAGSTFAAPIYAKWGEASGGATGVKLNYQAIGSGAGINQINNRTVDFGASDMPVAADQLTAHKLMQFPTVIGGVDIIVNLPGIKPDELKLTGELIWPTSISARSPSGTIQGIAEINPGVKLPSLAIAPVLSRRRLRHHLRVHRLSLGMQSPEWKSQGRLLDQREVAGRHRRQGQRRRRRHGAATSRAASATSKAPTPSRTT